MDADLTISAKDIAFHDVLSTDLKETLAVGQEMLNLFLGRDSKPVGEETDDSRDRSNNMTRRAQFLPRTIYHPTWSEYVNDSDRKSVRNIHLISMAGIVDTAKCIYAILETASSGDIDKQGSVADARVRVLLQILELQCITKLSAIWDLLLMTRDTDEPLKPSGWHERVELRDGATTAEAILNACVGDPEKLAKDTEDGKCPILEGVKKGVLAASVAVTNAKTTTAARVCTAIDVESLRAQGLNITLVGDGERERNGKEKNKKKKKNEGDGNGKMSE